MYASAREMHWARKCMADKYRRQGIAAVRAEKRAVLEGGIDERVHASEVKGDFRQQARDLARARLQQSSLSRNPSAMLSAIFIEPPKPNPEVSAMFASQGFGMGWPENSF